MNYNKGSIVIGPTFCNIPYKIQVEYTDVYLNSIETNASGGCIEYANDQGRFVIFKLLHNQNGTMIQQFNNQLNNITQNIS